MIDTPCADKLEIRELIENWAIWRDSGDWQRFATVWHDDGWMSATWFQGPALDFIRVSQEGWSRGVRILHFLGGSNIEVVGSRAVVQTRMTISQRASVHGAWCDVVCTGRFFDFIENRAGRWGMVRRQPIYEKDRVDPIVPGTRLSMDLDRLAALPEGYRHLAYLQQEIGYEVKLNMPGLLGTEVDALYESGRQWLRRGNTQSSASDWR